MTLCTFELPVVYTLRMYSSQYCTTATGVHSLEVHSGCKALNTVAPPSSVHSLEVQLSALYTSQWCTLPGGTALSTVHLSVVFISLGYSYQYCTLPSGVHSLVVVLSCTSIVYSTGKCTVLSCVHHRECTPL